MCEVFILVILVSFFFNKLFLRLFIDSLNSLLMKIGRFDLFGFIITLTKIISYFCFN